LIGLSGVAIVLVPLRVQAPASNNYFRTYARPPTPLNPVLEDALQYAVMRTIVITRRGYRVTCVYVLRREGWASYGYSAEFNKIELALPANLTPCKVEQQDLIVAGTVVQVTKPHEDITLQANTTLITSNISLTVSV
jgi:hypothetical protein